MLFKVVDVTFFSCLWWRVFLFCVVKNLNEVEFSVEISDNFQGKASLTRQTIHPNCRDTFYGNLRNRVQKSEWKKADWTLNLLDRDVASVEICSRLTMLYCEWQTDSIFTSVGTFQDLLNLCDCKDGGFNGFNPSFVFFECVRLEVFLGSDCSERFVWGFSVDYRLFGKPRRIVVLNVHLAFQLTPSLVSWL